MDPHIRWSDTCVDCAQGANAWYLLLLFLGGFGLCTLLYLFNRLPVEQVVTPANRFGIFLYFVQTATLLASASPSSSLNFFFHLVNFNIFEASTAGDQCPFPVSEHFPLFVPLLSQVFLLAMVPLPFVLWHACARRVPRTKFFKGQWMTTALLHLRGDDTHHWSLEDFLRCLVGVYWYGFYSVVGSALRFFHCITVRSFECEDCYVRVVQSHPSLDCDSSTYRSYSALFALVLVIELVIPLAICLALLRNGLNLNRNDRLFRIFSMFFRFYPSGHWTMLWELMGALIKRIPLLCVVVFSSNAQYRLAWCGALAALHLILQLCFRPFLDPVDNMLESFSLTCLLMMIFILVSSSSNLLPSSEQATTQFAFFSVISLILLGFVLSDALRFLKCKRMKQLDQVFQNVREKVIGSHQRTSSGVEMAFDQGNIVFFVFFILLFSYV